MSLIRWGDPVLLQMCDLEVPWCRKMYFLSNISRCKSYIQKHQKSWCLNKVGGAFSGLWETTNQSRLDIFKLATRSVWNCRCIPSCFCAFSFVRWRRGGGGRSAAAAGGIRPGQQLPQDASWRVPKRRPARSARSAGVLWRSPAAQRQWGLWLRYPDFEDQAPAWRSETKHNWSIRI